MVTTVDNLEGSCAAYCEGQGTICEDAFLIDEAMALSPFAACASISKQRLYCTQNFRDHGIVCQCAKERCSSHDDCGNDAFCSEYYVCVACKQCHFHSAAFDSMCPEKCPVLCEGFF